MNAKTKKLTVNRLAAIVQEELEALMIAEENPWHSKTTGKLSGPDPGNVYSISEPAAARAGWRPGAAKKGIVTQKGKLRSKYGLPTQCGRKSVSGAKIKPPKYSCSKFKEPYKEDIIHSDSDIEDTFPGYSDLKSLSNGIYEHNGERLYSEEYIRSVLSKQLKEQRPPSQQQLSARCKQLGMLTLADAQQQILLSLNAFSRAHDGKLQSKD